MAHSFLSLCLSSYSVVRSYEMKGAIHESAWANVSKSLRDGAVWASCFPSFALSFDEAGELATGFAWEWKLVDG